MFFGEFMAAFLVAILVVALFALVFRRTGPWAGVVFWVFVILLIGLIAVGTAVSI